jgi:hypothetical protein
MNRSQVTSCWTQDSHDNQQDNRGQLTVQSRVFYAGCLAVIKCSGFVNSRSRDQRFRRVGEISLRFRQQWEIERVETNLAFREQWETYKRDVQKELNVGAVIINCNCKEVPVNPIMKSRTHYYLSCKPLISDNVLKESDASIFRE